MKQDMDSRGDLEWGDNKKVNKVLNTICEVLVIWLFQAGLIWQMSTWFQLTPGQMVQLGIETGLLTLVMSVFYNVIGRQGYVYILTCGAVVLTILVRGLDSVYYGLFGMVNYIISWWNTSHEDAVSLVLENQITSEDIYTSALIMVIVMLILWWNILRHRRTVMAALIILVCITIGLVVDSCSMIGCGMMLAGWFAILMAGSSKVLGFRHMAWLMIVAAACIVTAVMSGAEKEQLLVSIKQDVDDTVEHLRYGEDTLPKGDLSRADELLEGDNDTLVVTSEVKKDMYLKGFVGARYQNGSWGELSLAEYKGDRSGMLKWLSDMNFMPVDQYSVYAGIDPELQDQGNMVTVKNVGASRRYIYAPYSADVPDGVLVTVNEDMNYLSMGFFGARNYEYMERSGDRPGELLYASAWANSPQTEEQQRYIDAENVYADFVYDSYLQIDDDMADMMKKVFFGDEWDGDSTIYAVTERIREVLENRATYQEQPEMAPEGSDPVSWFLNVGHQGNAVMYASTAVLAFRTQGIPARYVEGYRVAGDRLSGDPERPLTLTNRDSHAWVEVYLDSVGWVPVDVTPGFYYDTYTLLQMVQKPQNVNQSAVNEDSNNQGSQLDRSDENSRNDKEHPDRDGRRSIPLDILVILILMAVCFLVVVEFRRFKRRITERRKYERLSADERIQVLTGAIFSMIDMYGCSSGLGWNAAEVDEMLVSILPGFYPGEYERITELLEKNIYGGEELSDGELRTLYIYAEKLYQARSAANVRTRLKIRYSV